MTAKREWPDIPDDDIFKSIESEFIKDGITLRSVGRKMKVDAEHKQQEKKSTVSIANLFNE